jgi:hypothetical protein
MGSQLDTVPQTAVAARKCAADRLANFKPDSFMEGSKGHIALKTITRLNRLLGTYSREHESRLARDIVATVEDIKGSEENHRMKHPMQNKLGPTITIFREIYLSAKNISLVFGNLMNEGVLETEAEAEHNPEAIGKERAAAAGTIWVLRLELKTMEGAIDSGNHDHVINLEFYDAATRFVFLMRKDIDAFCRVHGVGGPQLGKGEPQLKIEAPQSATSPE